MKIIKRMLRYCTDSDYRFLFNSSKGLTKWLSDRQFIIRRFHATHGYYPDLDNPVTFSEKLQWLKLYDHDPLYTMLVDKAEVRNYVECRIGNKYLVPLIDIWDRAEDIDFSRLPDQFVLKCTHDSHGLVICKDKNHLDKAQAVKKLKSSLRKNYYSKFREWPYKNVKPRIIAEAYLDGGEKGLTDYKVHCFNGEPKFILVCGSRFTEKGLTQDFYSCDWDSLQVKRPHIPHSEHGYQKPEKLEELLELSRTLSAGIPFVRADFYIVDDEIFFGELTFFPASGFARFEPESYDRLFGDYLKLPAHDTNQK